MFKAQMVHAQLRKLACTWYTPLDKTKRSRRRSLSALLAVEGKVLGGSWPVLGSNPRLSLHLKRMEEILHRT